MKLSDFVASFLAERKVRHVFVVSGGASLHLIDSIARTKGTRYICPQHEQAGAMAADAYSRVSDTLGVAISTSGPGATNLMTGICGSFYDSIPALFITGQVSTFRLKSDSGVRQMGFQETDIVDMCRPITKYAVQLSRPELIAYELEKAWHYATSGRPGPVLIDIPDDLQRADVTLETMPHFVAPPLDVPINDGLKEQVERLFALIEKSHRPVLVLGWGVRLAGAASVAERLVDILEVPVLPTWAALDILPSVHPLLVGAFGTHGTRYGNFTVQNADLLISIGARLDTRATGGLPLFARQAKKVIIDIDRNELNKFDSRGMHVDLKIESDAKKLIDLMLTFPKKGRSHSIKPWLDRIEQWKRRYPICPAACYDDKDVNPYVFIKRLSTEIPENSIIVSDTGCTVVWLMQAFEFKRGQRVIHDFNNTAMGYALPASIGASLARHGQPVICLTGDGSLQMNIQELATVAGQQIPVKIIVLRNRGYAMIQQTQEQWLDCRYEASTEGGGVSIPDFCAIGRAYGLRCFSVSREVDLIDTLRSVVQQEGPVLCQIEIDPKHRVSPQVKWGRPIEDGEPLLARSEFLANMIIEPASSSLPDASDNFTSG